MILEQENLGKVRMRFLSCTVHIFVGLITKGCGQSFIKSVLQPTKKIPLLLALVTNTPRRDQALQDLISCRVQHEPLVKESKSLM